MNRTHLTLSLLALGIFGLSSDLLAQPVLKLPSGTVYPTVVKPGPQSYFAATFSNEPAGLSIIDQTYLAWCADDQTLFSPTTGYTLYNTYPNNSLPVTAQSANWGAVNWLLNNKGNNSVDVIQHTIWLLLDPAGNLSSDPNVNSAAASLEATALQNKNFVPGPGQVVAVLMYVDGFNMSNSASNHVQDLILEVPVPPMMPSCVGMTSTISTNFGNDTPAGSVLWFNSNAHIDHPTDGTVLSIRNSKVNVNGTNYAVPDADITFTSSVNCETTTYSASFNRWITKIPVSGDDEVFLTGVAIPVTAALANHASVSWTMNFYSSQPMQPVEWKWGAAAFPSFPADYNAANIKPGHQHSCNYPGGDHAGSPESLGNAIHGGTGGGAANITGSWTSTQKVTPNVCTTPPIELSCPASTGSAGTSYSSQLAVVGGISPYTFSITGGSLGSLHLDTTTGAITGTPSASDGTLSFTAKVVDGSGSSAGTTSANCKITTFSGPPPKLGLIKTSTTPTVSAFGQASYSYTVTNNGSSAVTIDVKDDNGTPDFPGDDFYVVKGYNLAAGAQKTWNVTVYPPIGMCAITKTGTVAAGTLIVQPSNGNYNVSYRQSLALNDNSYGTTASAGWAGHGHKFQDLTGSDQAEFRIYDGTGTLIVDFSQDYISSGSFPSGYGSLGFSGGDGKFVSGNKNAVTNFNSTLAQDLNQSPSFYGYTTNSPAAGTPGWDFVDGYSFTIIGSALTNGLSKITIPLVHNSPSINGTDQIAPGPCTTPVTNTATVYSNGVAVATSAATITVQ